MASPAAGGNPVPGRDSGVARGRLAASRIARELFPLPRMRLPDPLAVDSSRGRALWRKERLALKMGNEAVDALNWLAGHRDGSQYLGPDPMQLDVLERICELASRRYPGPDALSERAVVRQLPRRPSLYDGAGCITRVAPFRRDLVSFTESVEGYPLFVDAAFLEVKYFLTELSERMLRAKCPWPPVVPYFGPTLNGASKLIATSSHRSGTLLIQRRAYGKQKRQGAQISGGGFK